MSGQRLAPRGDEAVADGMDTLGFTYWQDGADWIGYFDEFPYYLTQGANLAGLRAHLLDLFHDLSTGVIPNVRRHAQLEAA